MTDAVAVINSDAGAESRAGTGISLEASMLRSAPPYSVGARAVLACAPSAFALRTKAWKISSTSGRLSSRCVAVGTARP